MANELAIPFETATSVKPIIPGDYNSVWEMSALIAASGLAPKDMRTREQVAVAIFYGMEIGMTPMAAVQSIAVINGRPSIWGDGALALVRSSPLCEYIKEWSEGEGESEVAHCETKRKNGEVVKRSFSYAMAKAANLIGKDGPWKLYRSRMMQMRARSWCVRDAYADLLRGFQIAEEQQDIVLKDVTPADAPPEPPKPAVKAKDAPPPRVVEGEVVAPKADPKVDSQKAQAKKDADAAREAAEKQEAEDKARDAEIASASGAADDDFPGDDNDPFERYLADFDAVMAKASTLDELKTLWMDRDKSWSKKEQTDRLVEVRDAHKMRVNRQNEEASSKREAEEFVEFDYRQKFLARLAEVKTAEEGLALKEEVDAHMEAGRITPKRFAVDYEDALTAKFETL